MGQLSTDAALSEILITWAELPLSAIRKDNIVIDESDSRPPVTVRISDFMKNEYYTYVKHDVSFAVSTDRYGLTHTCTVADTMAEPSSLTGSHRAHHEPNNTRRF